MAAACDVFSCADGKETERTVKHNNMKIKKMKRGFRITPTIYSAMDIYTPLEEAKEEIWNRWNDKSLQKKVEEYLGEVPAPLRKGPRSVLYRDIISPNKEFNRFLELSKSSGLLPLGYE